MSSTYNAITNLQEIEMDSLIVNLATIDTALVDNLDCNVGTIDSLTSTTASITSANIPTLTNTTLTNTTSNTTNLNTNNIQSNPLSSSVSLYTNGTGTLQFGNNSNTNLINILQSVNLNTDKNLTLNGLGSIITPNLQVSSLTPNKIVLTNGSKVLVSSSYTDTDFAILSANNTFTGNNIFSTFNTFNGNLLCNTFRGTSAGSTISLFSTTTAGITLGGVSSGISLADNTTLPANKTLTLNATGGQVICDNFQGTSVSSAISLFTNTTGNSINIGNTSNGNAIQLRQPVIITGTRDLSLQAGGSINCNNYRALNPTDNVEMLRNSTSGTFTIGNSTPSLDTGTIVLNRSTTLGDSKNLTLQSTGQLIVETIRGYAFANTINMYLAQLGAINFGNTSSTNPLTINNSTILASGKNLTLSATGKIVVDTIEGVGALDNITLFSTTTGTLTLGNLLGGTFTINPNTQLNGTLTLATDKNLTLQGTGKITTPAILVSGLTASKMVLTDTNKNLVSSSYNDTDLVILSANNTLSGNNIFSGTTNTFNNTILCSIYTGVNTGDNLSLFSTTLGSMILGNAGGGILTINPNTNMTGNLTMANTKTITTNNISGVAVGDTITLFGTTTTGSVNIGNAMTSSNMRIGNITNANDTGTLTINKNIVVGANKNLTLSGTSLITSPNLRVSGLTASKIVLTNGTNDLVSSSFTDTDFVLKSGSSISGTLNVNDIQGTTTSSSITLFTNSSVSSPTITLGSTSGGNFTINPSVVLASNKNLTLQGTGSITLSTTGSLTANNINTTAVNSLGNLFGNMTTGTCNIATSLTGNFNIATSVRNGFGTIGSSSFNSATDTGLLDIYLPTRIFQDITLSTANRIFGNSYQGRTASSNVSLFTLTSSGATIDIGNTGGGNCTINPNVVLASGKNITLSTTGKIVVDTLESVGATEAVSLYATTTTGAITLGSANTSSIFTIGNSTPSTDTGKVQMNKDLYMGTTGFGNQKLIACDLFTSITGSIVMLVSGSSTITLGDSSSVSPFTGGVYSYSFFDVSRTLNTRRNAYTNLGYGNATAPTLFKSSILSGKYLTSTLFTGANTDEWCSFESDTEGEGSAFLQNGNTQILVNPGDAGGFPLFWFDEDTLQASPAGSTSYAWTGWKISTGGAFTTASSRKIKRDIQPVIKDGLLDKLENIEFVNYKMKPPKEEMLYKNGVERQKYKRVHMGCIAEDVKQIFPECVERENADAIWMLNYTDLNLYFNKGVQELIKQNKQQQVQIDAQKLQIDDLTSRLIRLEQILLNP